MDTIRWGIDAVYVATPVGSHLDYALKVCAAGKPCYVEKPMARNATEARAMVEAFRNAKLPRFLKVRELVAAGAIDAVLDGYYGGRADAFWTRPESWPGLKQQAQGGRP